MRKAPKNLIKHYEMRGRNSREEGGKEKRRGNVQTPVDRGVRSWKQYLPHSQWGRTKKLRHDVSNEQPRTDMGGIRRNTECMAKRRVGETQYGKKGGNERGGEAGIKEAGAADWKVGGGRHKKRITGARRTAWGVGKSNGAGKRGYGGGCGGGKRWGRVAEKKGGGFGFGEGVGTCVLVGLWCVSSVLFPFPKPAPLLNPTFLCTGPAPSFTPEKTESASRTLV